MIEMKKDGKKIILDPNKKWVLISLARKRGSVRIVKKLIALGWGIISSGNTAKHLKKYGLEVVDVKEVTGYPIILDHRVVTLHPAIHGAILAKDCEKHDIERETYGIPRIHMVIVDVYPIWDTLAKPGITIEGAMDGTDIGGPTLLRGAAKNYNNGIIPICDLSDAGYVIRSLEKYGKVSDQFRLKLAKKVFQLMANYDGRIFKFLAEQDGEKIHHFTLKKMMELDYSENKYLDDEDGEKKKLVSIWRSLYDPDDPLAIFNCKELRGKLSYIAARDGDGVITILRFLVESFKQSNDGKVPYIVVAGKHGDLTGIGASFKSKAVAIARALYGDPVAIKGGEVVCNFKINWDEAGALFKKKVTRELAKNDGFIPSYPESREGKGNEFWGLDLVIAPQYSDKGLSRLSQGKDNKRRILMNEALFDPGMPLNKLMWKPLAGGGFTLQRAHYFILTPEKIQKWVNGPLSNEDFLTLIIVQIAAYLSNSNSVAIAKDLQLLGLGCGQQDRIFGTLLALLRSLRSFHDVRDALFGSDAFFPYATNENMDYDAIFEELKVLLDSGKTDKTNGQILTKIYLILMTKDLREGPQILADAGLKGGIVPADGMNLPLVEKFFELVGMIVAFVNKKHRWFYNH